LRIECYHPHVLDWYRSIHSKVCKGGHCLGKRKTVSRVDDPSRQPEGGKLRKVKILVVTLVASLLVASPAFATVFEAEVGFLTETELEGAGFELEIEGFRGD
jgi:hypothetical protein